MRPQTAPAALVFVIALAGCGHGGGLASGPRDPLMLRRDMARLLIAHRAFDAAMQPIGELLARRPDDVEGHQLLGIVYRERGLYAAAEQELRRAAELSPAAAGPHADLAMALDLDGRPEGGLVEHRRAVELAPQVAAYQNNLGYALLVAHRYDEAIGALLAALKADPSSRRARNNLGLAYGALGDPVRAAREFERGAPPAEAANNTGLVYELLGDPRAACEHFRRAMDLDAELKVAVTNSVRTCVALAPLSKLDPASPAKSRPRKEGHR